LESEEDVSDQELHDGQRPLNLRSTNHVPVNELRRSSKKIKYVEKRFKITELRTQEQVPWLNLQDEYIMHFFCATEILDSASLDDLVVSLWRKEFNKLNEECPERDQVRAVSSLSQLSKVNGRCVKSLKACFFISKDTYSNVCWKTTN